ncbi:helix-turn-helix domain-containing protein [Patulibacter minatonensis]|uniref:helix-turn-helix domain-containing protein n=1 Tax=Patulibacter minatonensis TaxID=298163 RepID=UPI00047AF381|nr:helix-turn-helix domain-containing protein [Patulibacter minatonensis]
MALDASADPLDLARRLQVAHSTVVEHDGRVPSEVRRVVLDSWRRTTRAGLTPDDQRAPVVIGESDIDDARQAHPLAAALPAIHQAVGRVAQDAGHLLVVTDATGTLLWAEGHSAIKAAAADLGFFEGARWSEDAVGTNAIGTALAIDHPVQIFSGEHFVRTHHPWVCSGAPIHDPETGAPLGVIDLSGPLRTAHPMILGFVTSAARMAEHLLAERVHRRDRVLHEALLADLEHRSHARTAVIGPSGRVVACWPHGWLTGRIDPPVDGVVALPDGSTARADVVADGAGHLVRAADVAPRGGTDDRLPHGASASAGVAPRVPAALLAGDDPTGTPAVDRLSIELVPDGATPGLRRPGERHDLSLRHAEILAVLAAHPGGRTGDELARDLYGPEGNPVTVRAELSRLRRLLGPHLRTRPYRLAATVDTDLARGLDAARRGRLAEAMHRCPAPLLPRSGAPAVVALREELDRAMRAGAAIATDAATLLAWTRTAAGREDPGAHDRLLGLLPADDPRAAAIRARLAAMQD